MDQQLELTEPTHPNSQAFRLMSTSTPARLATAVTPPAAAPAKAANMKTFQIYRWVSGSSRVRVDQSGTSEKITDPTLLLRIVIEPGSPS